MPNSTRKKRLGGSSISHFFVRDVFCHVSRSRIPIHHGSITHLMGGKLTNCGWEDIIRVMTSTLVPVCWGLLKRRQKTPIRSQDNAADRNPFVGLFIFQPPQPPGAQLGMLQGYLPGYRPPCVLEPWLKGQAWPSPDRASSPVSTSPWNLEVTPFTDSRCPP